MRSYTQSNSWMRAVAQRSGRPINPANFVRAAFAALLATFMSAGPAQAATIIGGGTEVALTAAPTLTSLGLSFNTFGSSSTRIVNGVPVATFLITGGTVNDTTGALLVRHDGSGILFSANNSTLSIGNFLIDSAAGLVSATTIANGTGLGVVPVFNIGPGLTLNLTSQAAGAFTQVFGAPNLTGATIGTADINAVVAVPEASTWAMMIFGFLFAGAALRSRQGQSGLATA